MPKDNIERAIAKGAGEGADGSTLRDRRLRGLRPGRGRRPRRGAHRQPQPHRLRRPPPRSRSTAATSAPPAPSRGSSSGGARPRRRPTASTRTSSCSRRPRRAPTTSSGTGRRSRCPRRRRASPACARASRRRGSRSSRPSSRWCPKTTVAIGDESVAKKVVRLVEGLEDNDDVQDVYANFDIPEAILEAVATLRSTSSLRDTLRCVVPARAGWGRRPRQEGGVL